MNETPQKGSPSIASGGLKERRWSAEGHSRESNSSSRGGGPSLLEPEARPTFIQSDVEGVGADWFRTDVLCHRQYLR
jgi:hypothetical protein